MTRKLVRLFLVMVFLTNVAVGDETTQSSHAPFEDDSYIEILILGDPVAENPQVSDDASFGIDDFKGCFLYDPELEQHSWTGEQLELAKIGSSLWNSPVVDVFEPQVFKLVESGYRFLTWDGQTTVSERIPANIVAQAAATFTPAVPALAFDIEREIGNAWMELQFGIAPADAPVPYHSTMDRYWQYYSDCDRWGVVFVDATLDHHQPTGEFWQVVKGNAFNALHAFVQQVQQVAAEIHQHAEFIKLESSVPTAFQPPFIDIKKAETWLQTQVAGGVELAGRISQAVALRYQASILPGIAERLVVDYQIVKMDWKNRQAKAYLAPRLNWLSQVLGAAAERMESSGLDSTVEVANESKNLMK